VVTITKMKNINDFFKLEHDFFAEKKDNELFKIWPYLRIYFGEQVTLNNTPGENNSKGVVKKGLQYFFYGFKNLFRSYDSIAFISSNQRKKIDGYQVHPFELLPKQDLDKCLFIELPVPTHENIQKLKHKYITSRYFFLLFELIIVKILQLTTKRNTQLFDELNTHFSTKINGHYLENRLNASYLIGKLMFSIWKPKIIYCTVPYTLMGYIKAAKEKKITVVELQHGFVGETHRAYVNRLNFDKSLYPDYFLCWGSYEQEILSSHQCNYLEKERILPVGHFYLDYLKNNEVKQIITKRKKYSAYKVLIAVSLQDPLEHIILPFIIEVAQNRSDCGFLLLPRSKPHDYYKKYNLPNNVILDSSISTYDGIIISDIHTTVWSTTAFEALYFEKPTILINEDNLASNFFESILSSKNGVFYASSQAEFIEYIEIGMNVSLPTVSTFFLELRFIESLSEAIQKIIYTRDLLLQKNKTIP
jgi:hypothetical protein